MGKIKAGFFIAELLKCLQPFADLLEDPDDAKTDSDGMLTLSVSVDDIRKAKEMIVETKRAVVVS